jgi:hypothetical protein
VVVLLVTEGDGLFFSLFSSVFHSCSAFPFLSFLSPFYVFFLALLSPSQDNLPLFPSAPLHFFLSFSFFSIFFFVVFPPSLFCSVRVVFIGAGGAGLTLTLSHHSTWGARPPCPTPVLGKVANGELLAGHDSPGFFIMRGCGLHWVLGFECAVGKWGEGVRREDKRLLFPCCTSRGRRTRTISLKMTLFYFFLVFFINFFYFSTFFVWGPKNG